MGKIIGSLVAIYNLLLPNVLFNFFCERQGYNGSQLWDTAFTVQAIISTGFSEDFGHTLKKAHKYVKDSQVSLIMR